ncbi:MAG: hypothetical protein M3O15_03505 [Acidobacteriota bacterium]|nr:hypothetical protein [Acidobacteriota bacterium]
MAAIEVSFKHPTNDRRARGKVDDTMTAQEVIDDLVRDGFVPSSRNGYLLTLNGKSEINPTSTLRSAGVKPDDLLVVVLATEAGSPLGVGGGKP